MRVKITAGLTKAAFRVPNFVSEAGSPTLNTPPVVNTIATISPQTGPVGTQFTITSATFTGTEPMNVQHVLTLNGVNVTSQIVNGVYTSTASGTLVLTSTAVNNYGNEDVSATSIVVAANQPVLPSVTTLPTISPATGPVGTVYTLTNGSYSGTAPIDIHGILTQDGVNVTSQIVAGNFTSTAAGPLVWTVTASNLAGQVNRVVNAVVEAAPVVGAPTVQTLPTISPAGGAVGTAFTLSLGSYNENGGGTVTRNGVLTLNGQNVTSQIVSGVYTSTAAGALVWTVTASNTAGSISRPANATVDAPSVVAPTVQTAPSIAPASGVVGTVFTLNEGVFNGTAPITLNGVLTQDGVNVTSQIVAGNFTSTAAGPLVWTVTASNAASTITAPAANATITTAAVAPTITQQPSITPAGAGVGDSITVNIGAATGTPTPVATWDILRAGVSVKSSMDSGQNTMELAASGTYTLTVSWTNSAGTVNATTATLVVAEPTTPTTPTINYATVALAYFDENSTYTGTATDVNSITPIGTAGYTFSRSGSGNAIQKTANGFQFGDGYYIQSQMVSNPPVTDGMFCVVDVTLTSYGSNLTQLLETGGLKIRNSAGTLQTLSQTSGGGTLSLGSVIYGTRVVIAGQVDDVLDVLSGFNTSGAATQMAYTVDAPTYNRVITGRYLNGTIHKFALVGRAEGAAWPVTMRAVFEDFQRGV